MKHYMAHIDLPSTLDQDFIALIPRQRDRVNALMHSGVMTSYALSMDRSTLWTIIVAGSEDEAMEIIASFPLYSYMHVQIHELAFHQNVNPLLKFSLN